MGRGEGVGRGVSLTEVAAFVLFDLDAEVVVVVVVVAVAMAEAAERGTDGEGLISGASAGFRGAVATFSIRILGGSGLTELPDLKIAMDRMNDRQGYTLKVGMND